MTKATVRIMGGFGDYVELPAVIVGSLAIHRPVFQYMKHTPITVATKGWEVSHVATGLKVSTAARKGPRSESLLTTQKACKLWAEAVQSIEPKAWTEADALTSPTVKPDKALALRLLHCIQAVNLHLEAVISGETVALPVVETVAAPSDAPEKGTDEEPQGSKTTEITASLTKPVSSSAIRARTRQHFADIHTECIKEVQEGKLRVNDPKAYIAAQNTLIKECLEGYLDHTFTFQQYANYLKTGECVPFLPAKTGALSSAPQAPSSKGSAA